MSVIYSYSFLFIGLGLNYLLNIFIGRTLGPSEYGQYAFALNIYNTVTLITVFGLDQAALRFVPQSDNAKEFVSSIIWLSITVVIISVVISLIALGLINTENTRLYLLFTFSVIPAVFLTHALAIAQAHHILISRMAIRYLVEPVLRAVFIFLILFFWMKSSLGPACAIFLSTTVSCIFSIFIYRKRLNISISRMQTNILRKILNFVLPLASGNVLNILAGRMDIIIVGAILISYEIGIYTAGLQSAAMIALILQGIELVYASLLSSSIGENNFKRLIYDYKTSLRVAVFLGAPLVIFLSFYQDFTSLLFGNEFVDSQYILAILCISQFANLATGSANQLLILFGYTRIILMLNAFFLVLVSTLVYLGTQRVGIAGAAIGIMCSSILLNISRVVLIYLKKKIHPYDIGCSLYIILTISLLIVRVVFNLQFELWYAFGASFGIALAGLILLVRRSDMEWAKKHYYKIRVAISG